MIKKLFKKKKKRAWIKVIEAFLAIAMFGAALFMIIQSDFIKSNDRSFIEEKQKDILTGIQLNDSLRNEVFLATDFSLNSNDSDFSSKLKIYLDNNEIHGRDCFLKICEINSSCMIENENSEVYAKEVFISASDSGYNPKKLKIFCFFEK